MAAVNHTSFNWPTAGTKQAHSNIGKTTILTGKSRRHSQSRLETSEGPLHQIVNTKRSTNNVPMHKLKKRLKQQMANHLQESLFLTNSGATSQMRELMITRAATNQSRAKAAAATAPKSRSKSRSPTKLINSVKGSKMRQQTAGKRFAAPPPKVKKTVSQFPLDGEDQEHPLPSQQLSQKQPSEGHFASYDATKQVAGGGAGSGPQHHVVRKQQFKTEKSNKNLNLYPGTSEKKMADRKGVLTKKTNENTEIAAELQGNNEEDQEFPPSIVDSSAKGAGESDELEDEQSVADEVIDPEAAAVVLRELGRLCIFKNFSDEEETVSIMSHRSHDNIGYVRSPLIECASLAAPDSEEQGDLPHGAEAAEEEERVMSSDDDGLLSPDFEDVSDEMGIPIHGVELLG